MSATLYRYQIVCTGGAFGTDYRVTGPDGDGYTDTLTELYELDGWRYVAVPDNITPTIPAEIDTWEPAVLTDELQAQIESASPHCRLIASRVVEQIRARYTLDDELYLARISVGALRGTYSPSADELARIDTYQIDVEAAREWGRQERAKLGLTR
jgi:hypothetical protein